LISVTHDTGQIREVCDRAIWVDDGRIRASGDVDEIVRRYELATEIEEDDGARFCILAEAAAESTVDSEGS
jgi:lipopolysaccharide transport system ATP-binding protein